MRHLDLPILPIPISTLPKGNVDEFVPNTLLDQATKSLSIATQLALVLVLAPWLALAVPVLALPYGAILMRVRPAARDTRRLEGVARTPVYTHFGDTLAGLDSVRAFGAEARFERENTRLVSRMAVRRGGP